MMALVPDIARDIFELPPAHAAERLYTVSRDLYAPVLAAFAARCLDTLAVRTRAVNLCLARDGISAFVAQRVLLRVVPTHFRRISPRRVRLIYLSRRLMAAALADSFTFGLADRYLRAAGLRPGAEVTLVDIGVHGQIQDTLAACYPECILRGEYLVYRRRPADINAVCKRGLLAGDVGAADAGCFFRRETIHLLEDLWSGVYESVDALCEEPLCRTGHTTHRGRHVRPRLYRLGERTAQPLPGGDLRRLKRAALRGVVDGVTWIAGEEALGRGRLAGDRLAESVRRLGEWIEASRAPGSPDAWLWHALIRPDRGASDDDG